MRRPSGTPNRIRREALPCGGSILGQPGERADLVLDPGTHAISDASEGLLTKFLPLSYFAM